MCVIREGPPELTAVVYIVPVVVSSTNYLLPYLCDRRLGSQTHMLYATGKDYTRGARLAAVAVLSLRRLYVLEKTCKSCAP